MVADRGRVANHIQKVLEDANIKPASVATDVLGVSGRATLKPTIGGENTPEFQSRCTHITRLEKRQRGNGQANGGRRVTGGASTYCPRCFRVESRQFHQKKRERLAGCLPGCSQGGSGGEGRAWSAEVEDACRPVWSGSAGRWKAGVSQAEFHGNRVPFHGRNSGRAAFAKDGFK